MSRSIDHLVLAVRDLSKGRLFFEQLGFQTAPIGVHPFGTGNHNVFFDRSFIEVLSVLDPQKIIPADGEKAFSFSAFNADFLKKREGISMMVINTPDARKDELSLSAAGWQTYPSFHFSRPNILPNGQEVEVAFTSTFCTHPLLPGLAFFVCQHHHPEYIWHDQYRRHDNQIARIAKVYLVCEAPDLMLRLFQALFDCQDITGQESHLILSTKKESIHLLKPEDFEQLYATECSSLPIPSIAAIDFELEDKAWKKMMLGLQKNKLLFRQDSLSFQLAPEQAFGTYIKVNCLSSKV
ncbi:MAG: VOC family protein [Bacteroidota bacterium]